MDTPDKKEHSLTPTNLEALRAREFASLSGQAYLDHALRGPLPQRALLATTQALEACTQGSLARPAQLEIQERARTALANWLGWSADELCFVQNTTNALATLAQALPWQPGERILTQADEVESNVLPWQALAQRGVELQVLPSHEGRVETGDVARALRQGNVRLLSLAAVALATGQRRDLRQLGQLAHEHGALFCVDAAQALGALQLDLSHVDAVCASGRKWLLGPPEIGFLAVRETVQDRLSVPAPGGLSRRENGEWRRGLRRFEGGVVSAPLLAGLLASLSLLEEVGAFEVETRILALAAEVNARARQAGLSCLSPQGEERSGVVHLGLDTPSDLESHLREEGVVVRRTTQGIRVSAHFWNTPDDLQRLFRALP